MGPERGDGLTVGYFESPIGLVEVGGTERAVTSLLFVAARRAGVTASAPVEAALEQVAAYFAGRLRVFDLPLDLQGTPFRQQVWAALLEIPYGETVSYAELAAAIGNPRAVRAVGAANGANPVSIVVPCHRVVGSDGSLTGYGGGVWRKAWLLGHEGEAEGGL